MKKIVLFLCSVLCLLWHVSASQRIPTSSIIMKQAGDVLQVGGVLARFDVIQTIQGEDPFVIHGNIKMQDGCFMIFTPMSRTWYDGESQWSYLKNSEEVTWTSPTQEELYDVNPYSYILDFDQAYHLGKSSLVTFQKRQVYRVILSAKDKDNMVTGVDVYISPVNFEVLFVVLQEKGQEKSQIVMTAFKNGLEFAKQVFRYKDGQIPEVELIDLR